MAHVTTSELREALHLQAVAFQEGLRLHHERKSRYSGPWVLLRPCGTPDKPAYWQSHHVARFDTLQEVGVFLRGHRSGRLSQ